MARYEVEVETTEYVYDTVYVTVEADDEDEAEELARDEVYADEVSVYSVTRLDDDDED